MRWIILLGLLALVFVSADVATRNVGSDGEVDESAGEGDAAQKKTKKRKTPKVVRKPKSDSPKLSERTLARIERSKQRNVKAAEKRRLRAAERAKARQEAWERKDKMTKKKQEAQSGELKELGDGKLNWLEKASSKSPDTIVRPSFDQFKEYVNNGPRPYNLFVSITALGPQWNCPMCHRVHGEMSLLAKGIAQYRQDPRNNESVPLYVVELELSKLPELWKELKLNTAPILFVMPARDDQKQPKVSALLTGLKHKYRYTTLSPTITAEEFADWLFKVVGDKVQVPRTVSIANGIFLLILLVAGGAATFRFRDKLLLLRQYRMVFLVVAWIGYLICISGTMYNVLRGTPFAGTNHKGETMYISPGSRDQFGAEGYLMGGCNLLCASMAVFLATNAIGEERDEKDKKKKAAQGILEGLGSTAHLLALSILVFVWLQIVRVYNGKSGGWD